MGNTLVHELASVSAPITNASHLKAAFERLVIERPVSDGRFILSYRCRTAEGATVLAKVRLVHSYVVPPSDLSHVESKTVEYLIDLYESTASNPHVLQPLVIQFIGHAAILLRPFIYTTLLDRIYLVPMLTDMERHWIAFQLIRALSLCHEKRVYHGDLHCGNVGVTSWNWVYLLDFSGGAGASVKPAFLPIDDPSYYMFFYGNGKRQECTMAPERLSRDNGDKKDIDHVKSDIFSLGCVLAQLYHPNGRGPFTFPSLLAYTRNELCLKEVLNEWQDCKFYDTLNSVLALDPYQRPTTEQLLATWSAMLDVDNDFIELLSRVSDRARLQESQAPFDEIMLLLNESMGIITKHPIIVLALVCSCVRYVLWPKSRLLALDLLETLGRLLGEESILQRIVPALVHLLRDKIAIVRARTILVLASLSPKTNSSISRIISKAARDPSVMVRKAFASGFPTLFADSKPPFFDNDATANYALPFYEDPSRITKDTNTLIKTIPHLRHRDLPNSSAIGSLRDWQPSGQLRRFLSGSSSINTLLVAPDHQFLAAFSSEGLISVMDCRPLARLPAVPLSLSSNPLGISLETGSSIAAAQSIPKSSSFAVAFQCGRVSVFHVDCEQEEGKLDYRSISAIAKLELKLLPQEYIRFLHCGLAGQLYCISNRNRTIAFSLESLSTLWDIQLPLANGMVTSTCISPYCDYLVVGTRRGLVCLVDLRFGIILKRLVLESHPAVADLAIGRNPADKTPLIIHRNSSPFIWMALAYPSTSSAQSASKAILYDLLNEYALLEYRISSSRTIAAICAPRSADYILIADTEGTIRYFHWKSSAFKVINDSSSYYSITALVEGGLRVVVESYASARHHDARARAKRVESWPASLAVLPFPWAMLAVGCDDGSLSLWI